MSNANKRAEQVASHLEREAPPDKTAAVRAMLNSIKGKQRLEGKVCIVTGAGSVPMGIGRSTCVIFAEAGARAVYALDIRSPDNFASLAAEIKKVAPNCHFEPVIADAASEADVKGICDKALKDHGRLDVFFANAGINGNLVTIASGTASDFMEICRVNLLSCFLAAKYASLAMRVTSPAKPESRGSIVMTASVAGISSTGSGGTAYGATKAGVINIARTGAWQLGRYNIRINCIAPGFVQTGMSQPAFTKFAKRGALPPTAELNAMFRHSIPEEQGYAVLFLASDEASYVTGQTLPVDGAVSTSMPIQPGKGLMGAEDRTGVRHTEPI